MKMLMTLLAFTVAAILTLASPNLAQQSSPDTVNSSSEASKDDTAAAIKDEELRERFLLGAKVIEKARQAIYKGIKPEDVKTIYFKAEGKLFQDSKVNITTRPALSNSFQEVLTTQDAYFVELPYKFKTVRKAIYDGTGSYEKGHGSELVEVFDFDEKEVSLEHYIFVRGKRYSSDAPSLDPIAKETNTLEFNNHRLNLPAFVWQEFFPFVLLNMYKPPAKFMYIGKAEAPNGKVADILEVKLILGQTKQGFSKVRLFFDEKTHLLLMATLKHYVSYSRKKDDGDYDGQSIIKSTYYFSDRAEVDGLLIPRTIKIAETENLDYANRRINHDWINPTLIQGGDQPLQETDTLEGKHFHKYSKEMIVKEFKVNQNFEKNTFELKNKLDLDLDS